MKNYVKNSNGYAFLVKANDGENAYRIVALTPEERIIEVLDPKPEQLEMAVKNLAATLNIEDERLAKAVNTIAQEVVNGKRGFNAYNVNPKFNYFVKAGYEEVEYKVCAKFEDFETGHERVIEVREPKHDELAAALLGMADNKAMKLAIAGLLDDVASERKIAAEEETLSL